MSNPTSNPMPGPVAADPSVCLGVITGAHGLRGLVKVRPFTQDPKAIVAYGPLTDGAGRKDYRLHLQGFSKGHWLARVEGVDDRAAARALRGTRLCVPRARLPGTRDDEFYCADLVGMAVQLTDGRRLGSIAQVQDFGAGVVLDVRCEDGTSVMVPFTRRMVPVVDIRARRVVVQPVPGLLAPAEQVDK